MPKSVFLSYQGESRSKVAAVRNVLEANYIDCWMDKREIIAGDDWLKMIRNGLENSQLMVLFLTESCEKTDYVKHELLTAEALGLPILVVRLEKYRPAGAPLNRINRFQALDAFDASIEKYFEDIVYTVRRMILRRAEKERTEGTPSGDPLLGSPVADIGNLVYDAWIKGFLQPTIAGLVVTEGHSEGIDRPYTFSSPTGAVIYKPDEKPPLPILFSRGNRKANDHGGERVRKDHPDAPACSGLDPNTGSCQPYPCAGLFERRFLG